jgi:hypothetical protein
VTAGMPEHDKRLSRDDAIALLKSRIDHSDLRYHKDRFGLEESALLADHFELVHLVSEARPLHNGREPCLVHRWGVNVNGVGAGYISTNFAGTRHKFLPCGYSADDEVPE